MSALMMVRKCEHCGHRYMYNPSTGNFGLICPNCKKAQSTIVPSQSSVGEMSISSFYSKNLFIGSNGKVEKDIFKKILEQKSKEWIEKTVDAFLIHSQVPVIGSVVYCNLALAFEHTGIYVGNGKVVHLNGDGMVEKVSFREFVARLEGSNPSVSIFCATDKSGHTPMIGAGINVNTYNESAVVRDGGVLDYCRLNKITVQPWSPMQYGFFEGCFIDNDKFPELNGVLERIGHQYGVSKTTMAMAWILRHPAKMQPVTGTTNLGRLAECLQAADLHITREEWYEIYRAAGNTLP